MGDVVIVTNQDLRDDHVMLPGLVAKMYKLLAAYVREDDYLEAYRLVGLMDELGIEG